MKVIRVLCYEGPEEWLEHQLSKSLPDGVINNNQRSYIRMDGTIIVKTVVDERPSQVAADHPAVVEAVQELTEKQPMRCDIDLDWCTYTCPCGETLCTRFTTNEEYRLWVETHRHHTNGQCIDHTTKDGERAWGGPVPDETRALK